MVFCFTAAAAMAGSLDSPAGPTEAGSAMNTLEDIYNLINLGTTKVPRTGPFAEPTAVPAATGHTLTQVYERAKTSSRPAKTGQTSTVPFPAPTGSDGDLRKGVTWPSPRFTDNNNGTVTDNLTGLIWLKNANCGIALNWGFAIDYSAALAAGDCGLSDSSTVGQWRLPNRFELESLLDLSKASPALPEGHPFSNVQAGYYWSSTTRAGAEYTNYAWSMDLQTGYVPSSGKGSTYYVWPVRGGQSNP
jgi:hypothetical protein